MGSTEKRAEHSVAAARGNAVRAYNEGSPKWHAALRVALGSNATPADAAAEAAACEFLTDAKSRSLVVAPVIGMEAGGIIEAAAAGVESPGSAALVLVPAELTDRARISRYGEPVRAVCDDLRARGVALVELLTATGIEEWGQVAETAGLRQLTDLVYMVRAAGYSHGPGDIRRDLKWVPFTRGEQSLFEDTLVATYVGSEDCPELCGLRPPADVLAGHRSAGEFDGVLWVVAMLGGKPAGLLLLARLPRHRALELVYMGVCHTMRGKGVADALLRRAVDTLSLEGAELLALAVDARNERARRVYERWGFRETGRRSAWITSS